MLRRYTAWSRVRRPNHGHTHLHGELPELFAGRRPIHVRRDDARSFLLELEPTSQFRGGGRLARALQAHQQDHRGADRREVEACRVPPSRATISSRTSFTTCWPGLTDLSCSAPTARSRTRSTKPRVTSKLTSASSK